MLSLPVVLVFRAIIHLLRLKALYIIVIMRRYAYLPMCILEAKRVPSVPENLYQTSRPLSLPVTNVSPPSLSTISRLDLSYHVYFHVETGTPNPGG